MFTNKTVIIFVNVMSIWNTHLALVEFSPVIRKFWRESMNGLMLNTRVHCSISARRQKGLTERRCVARLVDKTRRLCRRNDFPEQWKQRRPQIVAKRASVLLSCFHLCNARKHLHCDLQSRFCTTKINDTAGCIKSPIKVFCSKEKLLVKQPQNKTKLSSLIIFFVYKKLWGKIIFKHFRTQKCVPKMFTLLRIQFSFTTATAHRFDSQKRSRDRTANQLKLLFTL